MNQTCVNIQPMISYIRCPVDSTNTECSGRGVSILNIQILELRQHKNDSIETKIIASLKLPLFFTTYKARKKHGFFKAESFDFIELCLQLIRLFKRGHQCQGIFVFNSNSALFTAFELIFLCSEWKWRPPRKIRQKKFSFKSTAVVISLYLRNDTEISEYNSNMLFLSYLRL